MNRQLDQLLSAEYLDGIETLDIGRIRAMKADCGSVETGLSFLRRMVQGRLDLVSAEAARRDGGLGPGDLDSMIAQLPDLLSSHSRGSGPGRLPATMGSGTVDDALASELDRIADPAALSNPGGLSDAELADVTEALGAFERRVSDLRRSLFAVIDTLDDELIRRYRSGEASVDELLR